MGKRDINTDKKKEKPCYTPWPKITNCVEIFLGSSASQIRKKKSDLDIKLICPNSISY